LQDLLQELLLSFWLPSAAAIHQVYPFPPIAWTT
jgi:hypothetical protein